MTVQEGRINEDKTCFNCSADLRIDVPNNPGLDFVKVVCSKCGAINKTSIIRLQEASQ